MNGAAGRTAEMVGGAENAREPSFQTMQQQHAAMGFGYRKTSILDNLQPSGNGMSGLDKQRQMYGIKSLGQDQETADKGLWLKGTSNPNPALYNSNMSFG